MLPNALHFHTHKPPPKLLKLGLHLQTFDETSLRELDPSSAHWVYFLPADLLDGPLWKNLRVRFWQTNRCFVIHGEPRPSGRIVRAMRDGAFDFIYTEENMERWSAAAQKAAESQHLWLQLYGTRAQSSQQSLVGKSAATQSLIQSIARIGPTAANVLITGESGTGKEKVAQALHQASGLAGQFLAVNCAAIPRDLIESELFGSEKGAFSGAVQARPGLVEQAAGGSLFLDEIGELDISLQPKLLRFLESRRARRVGGNAEYAVDARILAATNRDLESEIGRENFRADLFYRLSEITLKLPPLRNHAEDVPMLAMHFLNEANEKFGKNFAGIEPLLVSAMMNHPWPGNARELRAAIHRMAVLHDGPVLRSEWWEPSVPPAGAPKAPSATATRPAMNGTLNRRQKWEHARALLQDSGNDQTWTAAQLGVHPSTLFRWIKSGKI